MSEIPIYQYAVRTLLRHFSRQRENLDFNSFANNATLEIYSSPVSSSMSDSESEIQVVSVSGSTPSKSPNKVPGSVILSNVPTISSTRFPKEPFQSQFAHTDYRSITPPRTYEEQGTFQFPTNPHQPTPDVTQQQQEPPTSQQDSHSETTFPDFQTRL